MTLFQELDLTTFAGGRIVDVEPGSVAAEIGIRPGDELLAINGKTVQDVIDVQYYGADEYLELLVRRVNGSDEYLLFEAERDYHQSLGLSFAHPTFDTDIRRCNNLCEFCFVLQMPPRFRRTLYIKDDDYRYSFLFGHYVTLTNLSDNDWWRIETMRLSPLYVSVHVTDLALRRQFLRNEKAPDIMEQLQRLVRHNIEIHSQLVIVPGFNDGHWLERSIRELAALHPAAGKATNGSGGVLSVSVVPVGLTRQHKYQMRTHTKEEAAAVLDYVESLQPGFQKSFGSRFVYLTDEWYLVTGRDVPPLEAYDGQQLQENGLGMVRQFLDEWEAVKKEMVEWQAAGRPLLEEFRRLTLVTATLFAPTLRKATAELIDLIGLEIDVLPAINLKLGDSITVAGLLMGNDVLQQLEASGYGDLVVLPRVMFDHPATITLDDLSPQNMADRLGRPVALADTLGDVWDALTGQSRVVYRPGDSVITQPPEPRSQNS
jgi:putative radical SAM enzyme (TIGR03279 family)